MKGGFKKYSTLVLAVVVLLVFLQNFHLLTPFENLIIIIIRPLGAPLFNTSSKFGSLFIELKQRDALDRENKELKERLAQVEQDNVRLKSTITELSVLREELSFIEEKDYRAEVARVIGKSSDGLLKMLILNKGSRDGISENLAVVAKNGILVGKIVEVKGGISKMLLITDNNFKTGAVIQNDNQTPGLVEGELGLTYKMNLIPFNEEVKEGQLVVTSGLEDAIPPNLVIGRIKEIATQEGELFKSATLEPLVALEKLSLVTILLPKEN